MLEILGFSSKNTKSKEYQTDKYLAGTIWPTWKIYVIYQLQDHATIAS